MKEDLNFIEVAYLTRELQSALQGRIDKIFSPQKNLFVFQLYKTELRNFILKLAIPSYISISEFKEEAPEQPAQLIMFLRKCLKGAKLIKITQVPFERIVEFSFDGEAGKYILIIELFGKGNLILCDIKYEIKMAVYKKIWSTRVIKPREKYLYPPKKNDISTITPESFKSIILSSGKAQLVQALAVDLALGGSYSEELCALSNVNKSALPEEVRNEEFESLFNNFQTMISDSAQAPLKPIIIYDSIGEPIDALPRELTIYKGFKMQEMPSFNSALDNYFLNSRKDNLHESKEKDLLNQINHLEKIKKEHLAYLEDVKLKSQRMKVYGDKIYEHFNEIKNILDSLATGREKYEWKDILKKIEVGKSKGYKEALLIKEIDPPTKVLVLNIEEGIPVDFTMSITDIARSFYGRSKKLSEKLPGVEEQIQETQGKIDLLKLKINEVTHEVEEELPQKKVSRSKQWFERFLWLFTKNNFLLVGGRDATQNEIVIKKHAEANDLVFHTDAAGSPFGVLKEGKNAKQEDIIECANFILCHSKSWKNNIPTEVYYVSPEQVSKKAPSGEHIAHGGFMIYGKKNYVRELELRFAVGVLIPEMKMISGPIANVSSKTKLFVTLIPGSKDKDLLAKEIKARLLALAREEEKEPISKISLEEIKEHALQASDLV